MTLEQQIIEEGARFDRTVGQVAEMCKQAIDGLKYPRWKVANIVNSGDGPHGAFGGTHRGAAVLARWWPTGRVDVTVRSGDLAVSLEERGIKTRSGFNIIINRVIRALDAAAEEV